MGSSAVQVSIATYSAYTIKEGGKNKSIGQFDIIGKGWDFSLGGFAFDVYMFAHIDMYLYIYVYT
jgi:hypothetical protein